MTSFVYVWKSSTTFFGFTVANIRLPSYATRHLVNSICNRKTDDLRSKSLNYNRVIY